MSQVVYAKLKIRQLASKAEGGSGQGDYGGLSNSMMGGGLGAVQAAPAAAHQGFGHKNYDLVYGVIKGSVEEQGVDRSHINNMVSFCCLFCYFSMTGFIRTKQLLV